MAWNIKTANIETWFHSQYALINGFETGNSYAGHAGYSYWCNKGVPHCRPCLTTALTLDSQPMLWTAITHAHFYLSIINNASIQANDANAITSLQRNFPYHTTALLSVWTNFEIHIHFFNTISRRDKSYTHIIKTHTKKIYKLKSLTSHTYTVQYNPRQRYNLKAISRSIHVKIRVKIGQRNIKLIRTLRRLRN